MWRGKDELDNEDLVADAPPIYIQEKIDPRVLIENLRDTATRPEDEPELTLFEAFDGLDELDLVEFYTHEANWSNRMILGDSLSVMASLAEREALRGKVQMIYIDPPYGISSDPTGRYPRAIATCATASSRTPRARSSRSRRSVTPGNSGSPPT